MDHHVCRPPPLGISVLIIGTRYNAMVAQGLAREDARAWIEEVEGEFRKRLDALLIGLAERQAAEGEFG